MKRTTVTIDDGLLRRAKELAARRGKTLSGLLNDLLRQGLARNPKTTRFKLELEGWEAELQPGVDILDRDKLFDLMDGR